MEHEPCDQEKLLGGGKNGSTFFKLNKKTETDARIYAPKMLCPIDLQDNQLQGDYNAQKAKNLMVIFEKCHESWSNETCKSDAEIEQWIKGKFIAVLTNQKKFIPYKFGDERMEIQLQLNWYALNSRTRTDYVNHIVRKSSLINDNILSLGQLTMDEEIGFTIDAKLSREMTYDTHF